MKTAVGAEGFSLGGSGIQPSKPLAGENPGRGGRMASWISAGSSATEPGAMMAGAGAGALSRDDGTGGRAGRGGGRIAPILANQSSL